MSVATKNKGSNRWPDRLPARKLELSHHKSLMISPMSSSLATAFVCTPHERPVEL